MSFEMENAQRRLAATEAARTYLEAAANVLADADVQNGKVAKAIIFCKKELSAYKHVTEFAIRKREKRAHDKSAR